MGTPVLDRAPRRLHRRLTARPTGPTGALACGLMTQRFVVGVDIGVDTAAAVRRTVAKQTQRVKQTAKENLEARVKLEESELMLVL